MRLAIATLLCVALAAGAYGCSAQPPASNPRCQSLDTACGDLWIASQCKMTKSCVPRWERLDTSAVGNDTELCALCKQMVQQAKDQLLSNETQSELKQVLEGSCDILVPFEPLKTLCKKLMDSFLDELNDMLVSRMDPTQVCTVSGLCYSSAKQSDVFERVSYLMLDKKNEKANCDACKKTVDKAVSFTKFIPQGEVINAFVQICQAEPDHSKQKCQQFAQTYVAKFFETFNRATSERTCQALQQCPGDMSPMPSPISLGLRDDLQCEFCEAMVHKLVVQFNNTSTKEQVKTVLENVCKHTGSWAQECLDRVEQDFDKAYDELICLLNPPKVCGLLGLCPASVKTAHFSSRVPETTPETMKMTRLTPAVSHPSRMRSISDAACDTCTYIANVVDKAIASNITEGTLKTLMHAACFVLPANKASCKDFVDTNLPALIEMFRDKYTVDYVCSNVIPLCPKKATDTRVRRASHSIAANRNQGPSPNSICTTCELGISYVAAMLNATWTENEIIALIDEMCDSSWFPDTHRNECRSMVAAYGSLIMHLLVDNMDSHQICTEIDLCPRSTQRPVLRATKPVKTGGEACELCQVVAGYLVEAVNDNVTENDIEAVLEQVCMAVPGDPSLCQRFIDQNVDKIYRLLREEVTVDHLCKGLDLCGLPRSTRPVRPKTSISGQSCILCTVISEWIFAEIKDNTSEAEIFAGLDKACTMLPYLDVTECQNIINTYGGMIFTLIKQNIDPTQVCSTLGFCTTPEGSDNRCAVCAVIANWILDEVKDNTTDAAIVAALEKVCTALPIDANKCKSIADTYAEELIIYIQQDLTADQICRYLGLCAGAKPKKFANSCEACTVMADFILDEIKGNKTAAAIIDALEKVCNVIPVDGNVCRNIIDTYGSMVISAIQRDLTPGRICKTIGLCARSTLARPVSKTSRQGLKDNCVYCTVVANWLVDELKNDKTDEAIVQALGKVCTVLPIDNNECRNFVNTYASVLIDYLKNDLTADQICKDLGLCASEKPARLRGEECVLCTMVANYLLDDLKDNKTEAAITMALEKVCSVIPFDQVECKNYVDTYSNVLIQFIQNNLTADEICSTLGLCTARPVVVKRQQVRGDFCAVCEIAADWLVKAVANNHTEAAILNALDKVCSVIPVNNAECQNVINTYGGILFQLLEKQVTPAEICAAIQLCSQPRAADQACPMCQIVVNVVEAELKNNNTRHEIDVLLNKVCWVLPTDDQAACHNMINVYTGYIIEMVESLASPEEICQTLGFCPTPPTNVKCEICMFITNFVESQLSSNRTQTEIRNLLDKVCNYLPNMNVQQCKATVDQFADMIITLLVQTVPPRKICEEIRQCPIASVPTTNGARTPAAPVSQRIKAAQLPKDEKCSLCKWLVTWVDNKLKDNRTEAIIKEELDKACDLLSDSTECKSMVDDYVDMIVKMLVQYADAEKICEALRKCPKKTVQPINRAEPPCQLCKYYVQELRNSLKSNSTENEIKNGLYVVCAALPLNAKECTDLVDQYTDFLVKLILENTDPEAVCEALRACPKQIKIQPTATNCDYCQVIMNFISMEVKDEDTDDKIVEVIEKVCDYVPKQYQQDCHRMVEIEGMVIVRMIAESVTADDICAAIKLCPTDGPSIVCTWCEYALHYIQEKLYDNSTQSEIQSELDLMCAKLKNQNMARDCKEFVDFYGRSFEVIIAQGLDPSVVCPAIQACPASRANRPGRRPSTERCHDCVSNLKSYRRNPRAICNGANAQFLSKCQKASVTVGIELIDAFGTDYNMCKVAKACTQLDGSFSCNRGGCQHFA